MGTQHEALADVAKTLRVRKRYSQTEIAFAYGYTQPYISMLERAILAESRVRSYIDFLAVLTPNGERGSGDVRVKRRRGTESKEVKVEFKVLEDRSEIGVARRKLRKIVADSATKPRTMTLGHQGNSWLGKMYYVPAVDLWTVFDDGENEGELWNTYGLGNPLDGGSRNMVCHLSVPIEGIDRRTGAVYARSKRDGKTYVLHRGKIGGGRKGVGKSSFFTYFRGKVATASDGDRVTEFAVVACLDSPNLLRDVRKFVTTVDRIKRNITE